MTPLIRETIGWVTTTGLDPVELQWFDISSLTADQLEVKSDPLMHCRPPFQRCMVVGRGPSKSHSSYDTIMIVVGDDPDEGIIVDAWKGPTNVMPRKVPTMIYTIENEKIMYGAVDENDPITETDARVVLGLLIQWYATMAADGKAYQPSVRQTFTNLRKIKAGKQPSYEWRTVVIDGKSIKCKHQGGTHASPRLHDRRGHLRKLPSGKTVWVKQCKVGDVTKGIVFHDYEVKV